MSATGRATVAITVGQSTVKASQLFLAVALVRVMSLDDWNQAALLLTIHLAAVTFGGLGLQQSLLFFIAQPSASSRRVLQRTAALVGGCGVVIGAGLWFTSSVIGSRWSIGSAVGWLGVAVAIELPTTCAQPALVALGRFRVAALWDIAGTVITVVTVVVGASARGVDGLVAALVASAVVRFVAFGALVRSLPLPTSAGRSTVSVTSAGLRLQITHAIPLGLTLATGVLTRVVDKWFIALFQPGEVGRYAIAAQEVPLLAVVPYAGTAAVAGRIVEASRVGSNRAAHRIWFAQTESMCRLVIPLTVGVMLVAPHLVPIVTNSADPALVSAFLLFTAITLHRVAEYGVFLRAVGRPHDVLSSAVLLLVCNAAFAGFGAWRWGVVGSAVGTLLSNVVAWVWVVGRIAVASSVGWIEAFPWRPWIVAVTTGCLAAVVARAIGSLFSVEFVVVAVEIMTFVAVSLAADRWHGRRLPRTRAHLELM